MATPGSICLVGRVRECREYFKLPHRRTMLEGVFVVIWQQDLDLNLEVNRSRILACDNGSRLSRFGRVWACRVIYGSNDCAPRKSRY